MTTAEKYNQAKTDWDYIFRNYGDPSDYTGSNAESRHLDLMLENPCKKTAIKVYIERIDDVFDAGYESGSCDKGAQLPPNDPTLAEIADRYNIDYE